jgi:signal transduction histidine kinase
MSRWNRRPPPSFNPSRTAPIEEHYFVLSSLAPSPAQKRLACSIVVTLAIALYILAWPLSAIKPGRVDAFIPAYVTAMLVTDSITAILLFAQFSIVRSPALLVIANGYVFTALILIPFVLAFPGALAANGVIGGLQSPPWLYATWHGGFAMFVIAYAVLQDADSTPQSWKGSVSASIISSVAATAAIVFGTAFVIAANDARLPRLQLDPLRLSPLWPYAYAPVVLAIVAALVVLWMRRRSVLDLWLIVVMSAYLMEIFLNYYPAPIRYSIGWYAGRVCGVISASIILFVLLSEITALYGQLVRAVFAERREREARRMTGDAVAMTIAHEVKQPLAAMVTTAGTGLRWLNRPSPDVDEAKSAFKQIAAAGHRAGAVIDAVRAMFEKQPLSMTRLDLNDVIDEALTFARGDLQAHGIQIQVETDKGLPPVAGDRVRLQQVLLNLITNAIDSMATVAGPRVLHVRSTLHDDGVMVSVADTGTGIATPDLERIFDPLFTTKAHGMGMGLSICRSIIDAHDGRLWVAQNTPRGTVFQFVLRSKDVTSISLDNRLANVM